MSWAYDIARDEYIVLGEGDLEICRIPASLSGNDAAALCQFATQYMKIHIALRKATAVRTQAH